MCSVPVTATAAGSGAGSASFGAGGLRATLGAAGVRSGTVSGAGGAAGAPRGARTGEAGTVAALVAGACDRWLFQTTQPPATTTNNPIAMARTRRGMRLSQRILSKSAAADERERNSSKHGDRGEQQTK